MAKKPTETVGGAGAVPGALLGRPPMGHYAPESHCSMQEEPHLTHQTRALAHAALFSAQLAPVHCAHAALYRAAFRGISRRDCDAAFVSAVAAFLPRISTTRGMATSRHGQRQQRRAGGGAYHFTHLLPSPTYAQHIDNAARHAAVWHA